MKYPVFDLHCDTALKLMGRKTGVPADLRHNEFHIDLDRASKLPGYCQCFACFTTPGMKDWYQSSPVSIFERELESVRRGLERNSDIIAQAFTAQDVLDNQAAGKMSAILTIEGPAGIDFDPGMLELMYKVGFRITSLGWNEHNVLCGSHKTGGGLTDLGREYIKEAQRLGMIIDVSHCSDEAFWDMIECTQAPIIATHSNSRSVCDHSRNLTDDMFRAIVQTGGVAGFNQCAPFVGDQPDLDTACDHFLRFMELDPSGKHIALGGDLDGCDELPAGFEGVQSYPVLAERLLERGLSDENLRDIFWNNAFGVIQKCCI